MKTVKRVSDGVIERVKDEVADTRVDAGTYVYCKKEEYKNSIVNVEVLILRCCEKKDRQKDNERKREGNRQKIS